MTRKMRKQFAGVLLLLMSVLFCGCQGKTAADAADDGQTKLQWEADSELSADPEAEGLPGGEAGTE